MRLPAAFYSMYTQMWLLQLIHSGLMPAIKRTNAVPMPPGGSLSACELSQFEKWIADGMPNN